MATDKQPESGIESIISCALVMESDIWGRHLTGAMFVDNVDSVDLHNLDKSHCEPAVFKCECCNFSFSQCDSSENYPPEEKSLICSFCGTKLVQQSNRLHPLKRHQPNQALKCSFCFAEFTERSELNLHLSIHGENPFSCDFFNAETPEISKSVSNPGAHFGEEQLRDVNSGTKFFGREAVSSKDRSYLSENIAEKQTLIDKFAVKRKYYRSKTHHCEFCGAKFGHKLELAAHKRVHTGEKPFACNFCDVRFTQRGALSRHILVHTGEKRFSCTFCDAKFNRKQHLTFHERTHSGEKPFVCQFCDAKFTRKDKLRLHERIHTGEKPFTCKYCAVNFRRKESWIEHERFHTGETPFECTHCEMKFALKRFLVRHQKIHINMAEFYPITSENVSS